MSAGEVAVDTIDLFKRAVATAGSPSDVEGFLESVRSTPRYTPIRVYLVFYDGDLPAYVAGRADRMAHLRVANRQAGGFELETTYGRKYIRTVRGVFSILPSSVEQLYRLVTVSGSDFWNNAVQRFVTSGYPRWVRVFFRQVELHEAMKNLEHDLGPEYRVTVRQTSVKGGKADDRIPLAVPSYDSKRQWATRTEMTVDRAFEEAQESDQLVATVVFRIEPSTSAAPAFTSTASCRLSRAGQVYFTGLYRQFAEGLLPVLERAVAARMKLFEHRGLIEREYKPAKPLEMTFARPLFSDKETLRQFTELLMSYPRATKALLHGNPHLHASVADFDDGSSLEVWVSNPKRVLLIPRGRASVAAIGRLIDYIFSEFEEGDVSDYTGQR